MLDTLKYNQSQIHFGPLADSCFQRVLNEDFANSKKVIITDENVFGLWIENLVTQYPALSKAEIVQIPSGEEYKTIEVCAQIWEALSDYHISRSDLIINFGGGVITDLGGFVASAYKRGLKFVNIPTTLLSQVDASVGGKTGVDLGPFKNQIGFFADAEHVFIDDTFLSTLPEEQLTSGYAEMLKHGLIADAEYWNRLKSFDPTQKEGRIDAIHHSVSIKKGIVEQDHKEAGLRKTLNFGHTVGHGIEGFMLQNGNPILHGYGVAAGMIAEAHISLENGKLTADEFADIEATINSKFPSLNIEEKHFKDYIQLMHNDKKNSEGNINCSLLNGIGNCEVDQHVTDKQLIDALKAIA